MTYSKWNSDVIPIPCKRESQRRSDLNRYRAFKERPSTHKHPIRWQELGAVFDMKCAICGVAVDPDDVWVNEKGIKCFGRNYPTVDHIIPLKHGGTDTLDNVQLTCKHCNSSKGARLDEKAVKGEQEGPQDRPVN